MNNKDALKTKIQELESELQQFKQQLNNYKEVTIEIANVGDVLEDGCIVLKKENGLALLVAPESTEVRRTTWSKEFPEVFKKLEEQGFNPSQFFIPTKEQLNLAWKTIPQHFTSTYYWPSTEFNATITYLQNFSNGGICLGTKTCVRAFRCVTY